MSVILGSCLQSHELTILLTLVGRLTFPTASSTRLLSSKPRSSETGRVCPVRVAVLFHFPLFMS